MRPKKSLLGEPEKEILILARGSAKFKNKFELLVNDPAFQADVKILRKERGIDLENDHLIVSEKDDLPPLLEKYGLSEDWRYILDIYIIHNEFEEMGDPHGIQIEVAKDKKSANIKIFPETTLREIKSAYSKIIEIFKKGKVIKTTPAKEFERDSFILQLRQKEISYEKIGELVEENYGGKRLDEFELRKLVFKMKKRRRAI